jgi:hypothetical protein
MIQDCRWFQITELVPKAVYADHVADTSRLWLIFDGRVIWTADALRSRYGPMRANTWVDGGAHQYRGFRPWSVNLGAKLSQHRFGRALDLEPLQVTAEEIRKEIREHPDWDEFKWIRAVEDDVGWLHFDVRNWIGQIMWIKP